MLRGPQAQYMLVDEIYQIRRSYAQISRTSLFLVIKKNNNNTIFLPTLNEHVKLYIQQLYRNIILAYARICARTYATVRAGAPLQQGDTIDTKLKYNANVHAKAYPSIYYHYKGV